MNKRVFLSWNPAPSSIKMIINFNFETRLNFLDNTSPAAGEKTYLVMRESFICLIKLIKFKVVDIEQQKSKAMES